MITDLPVSRVSPVLYLPFFTRTFRDQSAEGNHGTPTSEIRWQKFSGIDSLRYTGSNAKITVPDDASLQLTTGTIVIFGFLGRNLVGSQRIMAKRDGGGTNFDFNVSGSTIELYDGTVQSQATVSLVGKRSVFCGFSNGNKPKFGTDGVWQTDGNLDSVISVDDAPLTIGALYTSGYQTQDFYTCALLYPDVLTAAEISDLHDWGLERITPEVSSDKRYWDLGSAVRSNWYDQIAAWDLGELTQGTLADKSGNGHNGTVSGNVSPIPTVVGRAGRFNGTSSQIALPSQVNLGKTHTILGTFSGNTDNRMVVAYTTTHFAFYLFTNTWYYRAGAGNDVSWSDTPDANLHRYAIVRSGTSVELFIDGASQGTETLGADNDLTLQYIGSSGSSYYWVGDIKDLEFLNRAMSDDEIAADYRTYAKKVMFHEDWVGARPSVANETTGMLGDSGWSIESGTWKISESATWKGAECVVAGQLKYRGLLGASDWNTAEFGQESGTPTLTKNASDLQIDALAGEKIGVVRLTLG